MPSPSNVILGGTNEPTFGTRVPAQNAAASLFRHQVARAPVKCDKKLRSHGASLVGHTEEGRLNIFGSHVVTACTGLVPI